jgi:hypothetical protein
MLTTLVVYVRRRILLSPAERHWRDAENAGDWYVLLFDEDKARRLGVRLQGGYTTTDRKPAIGRVTGVSDTAQGTWTEEMYYRENVLLTYVKYKGSEPTFLEKKLGNKPIPVTDFVRVTERHNRVSGATWEDLNRRLRDWLGCVQRPPA